MKKFSFSKKETEKFKRLGIDAIVLFGSYAQNRARVSSDYDFGLLVEAKSILNNPKKRGKIYDAIYDILSGRIKKLADIDIVFLENAPYELQAHVMKHGKVLYEARSNIFANYKARIILMYSDFAPLKRIFHKGILERI